MARLAAVCWGNGRSGGVITALVGTILVALFCGGILFLRNEHWKADQQLLFNERNLLDFNERLASYLDSESSQPLSSHIDAGFSDNSVDSERILTDHTQTSVLSKDDLWFQRVSAKINCLKSREARTFFYHTRKAGGTTIHDWLTTMANGWHIQYLELEGKSLDPLLLQEKSVFSITSLRDPIDRILSLYWYEHVAWWYDIKHEPKNCRTLAQWVDGWRDGSPWKSAFTRQNPGTVYVEVENYYVKSLIGWNGDRHVGEEDLQLAKKILTEQFDLIILMDDMSGDQYGSMAILTRYFGASTKALMQKSNKLDQSTRQKLESVLANDQVVP